MSEAEAATWKSSPRARALVVDLIARSPGANQAEIGRRTGLGRSSVVRAITDLRAEDRVLEPSKGKSSKKRGEQIRADLGMFIGVTVTPAGDRGIQLATTALDARGTVVGPVAGGCTGTGTTSTTTSGRSPSKVLDALARRVSPMVAAAKRHGTPANRIGVGVSIGGHVDPGGVVRSSPNLGWMASERPFFLADHLREELGGIDVWVENDVNALAAYERRYGLARDDADEDFAVVVAHDHIGAALVLGGELRRGANHLAGEIGHTPLDRMGVKSKAECGCGRTGCLEAIATRRALLPAVNEMLVSRDAPPVGSIAELNARDLEGRTFRHIRLRVQQAGAMLGGTLVALTNLVDVPLIICYGAMFSSAPAAREPGRLCYSIVEPLNRRLFPTAATPYIALVSYPDGPFGLPRESPVVIPAREVDLSAPPGIHRAAPARTGVPYRFLAHNLGDERGRDPDRWPAAAAAVAIARRLDQLAGLPDGAT